MDYQRRPRSGTGSLHGDRPRPRSGSGTGSLRNESLQRSELERYVAELKSDLEAERSRCRQLQRDKLAEIRGIRQAAEDDKNEALEQLHSGMQEEFEQEKEKLVRQVSHDKDREAQRTTKQQEDFITQMQVQFVKDRDTAVRSALEKEKSNRQPERRSNLNGEMVQKLQQELKLLRQSKQDMEDQYRRKCELEHEKNNEIKRLKQKHEIDLRRIAKETKAKVLKDVQELKSVERSLESKGLEIAKNENIVKSLEGVRHDLGEKLNQFRSAYNTPRPSSRTSTSQTSPPDKLLPSSNKLRQQQAVTDEKDKVLQRKIGDLNGLVTSLKGRISVLETENEAFKKKKDDEQSADKKIIVLKKRNAELAAVAKRLEEKAKHAQSPPKTSPKKSSPEQESDAIKKLYARQRARDLALQAKNMLAKEREIEKLQKQVQELNDRLASNQKQSIAENGDVYNDQSQLEGIIKQAAKERLKLERQLSLKPPPPKPPSPQQSLPLQEERIPTPKEEQSLGGAGGGYVDTDTADKLQALEDTNRLLQSELQKLEIKLTEKDKIETRLKEKEKDLKEKEALCEQLERDIQKAQRRVDKELRNKDRELQQKESELDLTKQELEQKENLCEQLQQDIQISQRTVREELGKKESELNKIHAELREKELRCSQLQGEIADTQKKIDAEVQKKEVEVRERESHCHQLQRESEESQRKVREELHQRDAQLKEKDSKVSELQKEIQHSKQQIKEELKRKEVELKEKELRCAQLQKNIEESQRNVDDALKRKESELKDKETRCSQLQKEIQVTQRKVNDLEHAVQNVSVEKKDLVQQNADLQNQLQNYAKVNEECQQLRGTLHQVEGESQAAKKEVKTLKDKVINLETLLQNLREAAEQRKALENDHQAALDSLQKRQEEVKKLYKVHDETKKEHSETVDNLKIKLHDLEQKCKLQELKHQELLLELEGLKKDALHRCKSTSSIEVQTDEVITQPPRISVSVGSSPIRKEFDATWDISSIYSERSHKVDIDHPTESTKSLDTGFVDGDDENEVFDDLELKAIAKKIRALSMSDDEESPPSPEKAVKLKPLICKSVTSKKGMDKSAITQYLKKSQLEVFVAKYSYDPVAYSPNECPETELSLNAGDYVMVTGIMDEDGFFEGELMDGRRGLVPSNFVEKVPESDLDDFHATLALGGKSEDTSSVGSSIQHDLDFNSSDESEKVATELPEDLARVRKLSEHLSDLEDIEEVDEETLQPRSAVKIRASALSDLTSHKSIPFPQKLTLDRQLTNSILIGWTPPENLPATDIKAYHIYVDEQFKTSVKGTERTKALVEGVNSQKSHRVCVRTVTGEGQSKDQECTITIGKDASLAPSKLKVSHISASSAHLSWMPGNSNYQHVVFVNDVEKRTLRPGLFRHIITGLSPDTKYKVVVRAKSVKSHVEDERNRKKMDMMSASTEFKTLTAGLPEPPIDVQVEAGPQDGMLLVTWIPVTITTAGVSNGAQVTGYAVHVDGKKMKEVNSPTADHVILEASHLMFHTPTPSALTVRTLAKEKHSRDSMAARIPQEILQPSNKPKESPAEVITVTNPDGTEDTPDNLAKKYHATNGEVLPIMLIEQAKRRDSVSSVGSMDSTISTESESESDLDLEVYRMFRAGTSSVIPLRLSPQGQLDERQWKSSDEVFNTHVSNSHKINPRGDYFSSINWEPAIRPNFHDEIADSSQSELSDIAEVEEEELSEPDKDRDKTPVVTPVHLSKKHFFGLENSQPPELSKSRSHETKKASDKTRDQTDSADKHTRNRPTAAPRQVNQDTRDHIKRAKSPSNLPAEKKRGERKSPNASILESPDDTPPDLGVRTAPHGAEADSPLSERQMKVPHIEITKDSSLSNGNYSDEDTDHRSYYSNSPGTSPRSPDYSYDFPTSRYSGAKHEQSDRHKSKTRADKRDQPVESDMHQDNKKRRGGTRSASPRRQHQGRHNHQGQRGNSEGNIHELTSNDVISPRHIRDDIPESELIDYEDDGGDSIPDEIDMDYDDARARLFIALFDYSPMEMSPNPDAADEELPFREGQLIKVYGDRDPDGFYRGEANNRIGFVPSNMISEVQLDNPELTKQLLSDSNFTKASNALNPGHIQGYRGRHGPLPGMVRPSPGVSPRSQSPATVLAQRPTSPVRKMIALYDYDPTELSPNVDAEVELSFRTGDIVYVFGEMDEDGFYYGEISGNRGLVPSNFLQEAPKEDDVYIVKASDVMKPHDGLPGNSKQPGGIDELHGMPGPTSHPGSRHRPEDHPTGVHGLPGGPGGHRNDMQRGGVSGHPDGIHRSRSPGRMDSMNRGGGQPHPDGMHRPSDHPDGMHRPPDGMQGQGRQSGMHRPSGMHGSPSHGSSGSMHGSPGGTHGSPGHGPSGGMHGSPSHGPSGSIHGSSGGMRGSPGGIHGSPGHGPGQHGDMLGQTGMPGQHAPEKVNSEEGHGPHANSPCRDKSPTDPNSMETTPLSSATQETPEEKSPSPQSNIMQLDPPEDSKKKEKKGFLAKTKGFSLFKKLGR
ncbi:peripheral-type benzodiazepine receptor-associated protein 1-like isoform X2 [Lineus longissimus]|uniref:peripheral-type benzodiazepine receptor-associated protein 1-like isoform X2 n=1 Tax=Lineus longissimus TaxID=88925 RepID=UPI00315D869F